MFSATVKVCDQPEVLVHHPDPRVERVARRGEVGGLAVEEDLALVRPVEAGEDVRERALAGAVLAEERVHLAERRLEVDAVVGDDAWEALHDPVHGHRHPRRGGGGWLAPSLRLEPRYPFGAAVDALDEPVHAVERVRPALEDVHPDALLDTELAALVVQRPLELVELALLIAFILVATAAFVAAPTPGPYFARPVKPSLIEP